MNYKVLKITGISVGTVLILGLIFFAMCFTHVDRHEFGYKYDKVAGTVDTLGKYGYIYHRPFVDKIHTIPRLPFQVRISNNQRVMNQKLVRFRPEGFYEFINLHPRGDYYVSFSVNSQSGIENNRNLYDIFMSYAYEEDINPEEKYPFLEILDNNKNTVNATDSIK